MKGDGKLSLSLTAHVQRLGVVLVLALLLGALLVARSPYNQLRLVCHPLPSLGMILLYPDHSQS